MPIPESQLATWSNQGATTTAKQTHESIRRALSSYAWPRGVSYEDYLQGSYRNSTNIRGDSDVDLVAELSSTMYSNLTDADERELGLTPAEYNWGDFRQDVILALTQYYGAAFIDTSGTKAIKVLPKGGRLQADVVVCAKYIHYHERRLVAEGMTFWTSPGGTQIINYPKLHYENGTKKNNLQHTANWYKPSIRMFKNARNRILNDNPHLKDRFPSYFIECLLHNVLDSRYGTSYQNTYEKVANWLNAEIYTEATSDFVCQNGMQYLFGDSIVQWAVIDAQEYVRQLIKLWNNW